jgi:hypothetical protein
MERRSVYPSKISGYVVETVFNRVLVVGERSYGGDIEGLLGRDKYKEI